MNWLQDLFIRLLSPWIPIVRKIQPKVRYRVLTACFMADLVLLHCPLCVNERELFL